MLVAPRSSCFFFTMAKWKLCFALLLPLTVCFDSEETLVKTIGSEPDVTPICNNANLSTTEFIVCKNIMEMSGGEKCRLLYKYGGNFSHECDSRFTLREYNQTVFLHLTSLTPEDSGNYRCECSHSEGTEILLLNITVEPIFLKVENRSSPAQQIKIPVFLIVVAIVTTTTAVIFGFIYRSLHHRKQPESLRSPPNMEPEDIEPYSTFIRREGGLYSTVRLNDSHTVTKEPSITVYNK